MVSLGHDLSPLSCPMDDMVSLPTSLMVWSEQARAVRGSPHPENLSIKSKKYIFKVIKNCLFCHTYMSFMIH